MNSAEDSVLRFVSASFPSVWALELLLALKRERRSWTRAELIATLRASEQVVSKALDALLAAGLASIEEAGIVYLPVNAEVEHCVEQAEQLYRSRPNAVRRAIVSGGSSIAADFANAFRIRRDERD